jgi:hypothetical protein
MRISTLALLSVLAVGSAVPASAEPAFFARAPVHAWHGEHFTIVRIDQLDRFDGLRAMLESWIGTYPDDVAALQVAILQNKPLASALRARNVQINNIGAIQQGFNGNLVFYLR